MQPWLLDLLRCPSTGSRLTVAESTVTDGEHLIEGKLRTEGENPLVYTVSSGVPNLMEPATGDSVVQTLDVFGTEWRDFANWGWIDDPGPTRADALAHDSGLSSDSAATFLRKTGHAASGNLSPDLGRLVIDCGCGNGRFSREAAKYAERVVAIDASIAAEVAFENMRRHGIANVGVVRASVLDLPLADGCADYAFSIGVLQHTGNAPRMIAEMARIIPPGHHVSINCYGKGSALYEAIDARIRKYTTKMDQASKLDFARKIANFDRKLLLGPAPLRFLEKRLRRMVVLRPTVVQMYDWYAPEIAEHYAPDDLKPLFAGNGLEIVAATHRITDPGYSDRRRKRRADPYSFLLRRAAA